MFSVKKPVQTMNKPLLSKRVEKCRTKVKEFDKLRLHFLEESVIFDNGVAILGVF